MVVDDHIKSFDSRYFKDALERRVEGGGVYSLSIEVWEAVSGSPCAFFPLTLSCWD